MTTVPTTTGTVVIDALSTPYTYKQGNPVLDAIIAAYAIQAQELEVVFIALWVLRSLEYAENDQLDVLGKIVGELRQDRSDADYKIAIGAKIRTDRSNGTVEDIISALVAADDREYSIKNNGQASLTVTLPGPIGTTDPETILAVLKGVKGAGIKVDLVYQEEEDDNIFTLSSSDAIETSTTKGLADVAGTTGGHLTDILE